MVSLKKTRTFAAFGQVPTPATVTTSSPIRKVDDDRHDALDAGELDLDDVDDKARRHPGVDGVAAGFEDREPRVGGQIMARGDRVTSSHHGRALRRGPETSSMS